MGNMIERTFEIITPIIGLVVGWLLNSISNAHKDRSKNQLLLGKSITDLYYLIFEIDIIVLLMSKIEKVEETYTKEKLRRKIIERYTLKNENSISDIHNITNVISSFYPSLGIELKQLLEGYLIARNVRFEETTNYDYDKIYSALFSLFKTTNGKLIKLLEGILIKISFRHSIILGMKMTQILKRKKKSLQSNFTGLLDSFNNG